MVLGLAGTANGAPASPADPTPVADAALRASLASSYPPAFTPLLDAPNTPAARSQGTPGSPIETYSTGRPVAPGVRLDSLDTLDARGWQRSDALSIDLTKGSTVGYLDSGAVAKTGLISQLADAKGAVAAVNGDFFDINNSGAPVGAAVADGKLVKSSSGRDIAAGFDTSGAGRILDILFEGSVRVPGEERPIPLARLNSHDLPADGIGAYTSLWGPYTRTRAVQGVSKVTEVLVADGKVRSVTQGAGEGRIPAGATVLLGRDAGADRLAKLVPGDAVQVDHRPRTSDGSELATAIGGGTLLVKDGVAQNVDDSTMAARMAIGFSADGRRMFLVTVDNRTIDSRGATLREMAGRLVKMGAHAGLEIDGGGSATMVTRKPGADKVRIDNEPSDGEERLVANGLGVYREQGSGKVNGVWVEPAVDPAAAAGTGPVPGGRPDRVFLGLTRTVTATPHDEVYGPVRGEPAVRWTATHGDAKNGVFRAKLPGTATVTAFSGSKHGSTKIEVLGPAVRLDATNPSVNVANATATASFGIVGYDRHGNSAPIEPSDLRLEYDETLLKVTPGAAGGFTVAAARESGAGLITVRAGELTTVVAVTVGVEKKVLADFDDAAKWTAGSARGTAKVTPVAEGVNGQGMRLEYDFTQSTATRTAYANAPQRLGVSGQSRAFGVSVYGHGQGEWTAFTMIDGLGRSTSVYGPYVTWEGWREVEIPVPAGLTQPVSVSRFYTIEIKADRSYRSEVLLDDLYVKAAPSIEAPPAPRVQDRLVVTDGTVDGEPWRFAVMSDAQFVGRSPDSPIVATARRTMREIRAARPDFMIIAGDLVDEASEADFQLAKRILDEEIGDALPYYYVPGNHEVMGASIENFTKYFGATNQTFDHKGTRFVTLNTSLGTLNGSGFDQLERLRQALDDAAGNDRVNSLVLVEHHPPRDPTPAKTSQLGDRKEAALIERWLADFQHETGKGAAFIGGHVGTFDASRVDGVPYLVNGNSGKAPSTEAANGGFTGWSMLGVDPVSRAERLLARLLPFGGGPTWLTAQIRPHVDALAVTAPARLAPGTSAKVTATVTQGDRQVPVAYPVSADWNAGSNVHVGDPGRARPSHIATFDPTTGTLTARRAGEIVLSVTVNGTRQEATIRIAP
ncbi:phosphodiester glycosidase family protein [Streptosporangium sp. NPDC002721]|uniref:phosphodiester glycosidase family protein n=1 Tax=Streptosporangium sp. NPDC002721 TaxID=3366188 RepID=UPI0036CBA125